MHRSKRRAHDDSGNKNRWGKSAREDERFMRVLIRLTVFGYSMDDLKGISTVITTHQIFLEGGDQPVAEYQRRLKPQTNEVLRKENNSSSRCRYIYHVKENDWVSLVHCVLEKGGFTVVANEHIELIPTRTVVRHRMSIHFRKLNKEARKDHYPLPFVDQTL
jgi:hypothetical protein